MPENNIPFVSMDPEVQAEHDRAVEAEQIIRNKLRQHMDDQNNPHHMTKDQIGLDKVDNTSDLEKPISRDATEALVLLGENLRIMNEKLQRIIDTGTVYTEGKGISIVNDQISIANEVLEEIAGKQDALSQAQLDATNSGVTAAKVEGYDGLQEQINEKQDTIDNEHKLSASLVDGLGAVATSNDYNDLNNKPTDNVKSVTVNNEQHLPDANGDVDLGQITVEQAQSDWNEDDNTDPAFIKNKPDLTIYEEKADLATVAESGSYDDLLDKPDLTVYAEKSDLGTAAEANIGTSAGDVPAIGQDGKLPTSVMPAITIKNTFVVNTEAAMLALTAQTGDMCIRTDLSKSFVLTTDDPTVVANWQELLTPPNAVLSVNGQVGTVELGKSDVGLGNVANTGDTSAVTEDSADKFTSGGAFLMKQALENQINNLSYFVEIDRNDIDQSNPTLSQSVIEKLINNNCVGIYLKDFAADMEYELPAVMLKSVTVFDNGGSTGQDWPHYANRQFCFTAKHQDFKLQGGVVGVQISSSFCFSINATQQEEDGDWEYDYNSLSISQLKKIFERIILFGSYNLDNPTTGDSDVTLRLSWSVAESQSISNIHQLIRGGFDTYSPEICLCVYGEGYDATSLTYTHYKNDLFTRGLDNAIFTGESSIFGNTTIIYGAMHYDDNNWYFDFIPTLTKNINDYLEPYRITTTTDANDNVVVNDLLSRVAIQMGRDIIYNNKCYKIINETYIGNTTVDPLYQCISYTANGTHISFTVLRYDISNQYLITESDITVPLVTISQTVIPGSGSTTEETDTDITIDGVTTQIKSFTKMDTALSPSSKNPVTNQVIYNAISNKANAEDLQELEQIALTTLGIKTGTVLTPVSSITDGNYYPTVVDNGNRWNLQKADSPTYFKIYDVSQYSTIHLKAISRAGHILTNSLPADFITRIHQNPTQVATWKEYPEASGVPAGTNSEQAEAQPRSGYLPYDKDMLTNGKQYLIVYEGNAAQAIEVTFGGGYSPITTSMFTNNGDGTTPNDPYAKMSDIKLSSALTASVTVGGITSGDSWPAGTSIETILRALLNPQQP